MYKLSELSLYPTYYRGQHDIANEFYLPCLSRSIRYDRAVGFYTSAIYIIAWNNLLNFISRNGKMRFIVSPYLAEKDADAIIEGYKAREDKELAAVLNNEFQKIFNDEYLSKPAKVLAYLVANEYLEFKIAFPQGEEVRTKRMFHEKMGIFYDDYGNNVLFKGSMNETFFGLSFDGNIESVDVFFSWNDGDKARINEGIDHFQHLWNNIQPGVVVKSFPPETLESIIKVSPKNMEELSEVVKEICKDIETANKSVPSGKVLKSHQAFALNSWKSNNRRGILKHATGSGKTFTAICAIKESLSLGEVPVIIVPSSALLEQWHKEIIKELKDLEFYCCLCGNNHNQWKNNNLLRLCTEKRLDNKHRIVISTIQTAAKSDFLSSIGKGNHIFFIVDEVHRIGSANYLNILSKIQCGPRLGLSATPERYGDPFGTNEIMNFFGGILEPVYTLKNAIEDRILTPYFYFPQIVELREDEQQEWDRLTVQINRIYAQINNSPGEQGNTLKSRLKGLFIKRATIIKSARGKVDLTINILKRYFERGQVWIIYCEDKQKIEEIHRSIINSGVIKDIPVIDYYADMDADKEQTLNFCRNNSAVIIAIRCLDEGVDIPNVTHALILASSKNPREFIQRRGRVLRRFPGKGKAEIHDTIVIPSLSGERDSSKYKLDTFIKTELSRSLEFSSWSMNKETSYIHYKSIAIRLGLELEDIINSCEEGFEDDSN